MSLSYADEKFGLAVSDLVTHPGAIHERLIKAWTNNIIPLREEDLKAVPQVAARFKKYSDEILSQPGETGRLVTWINQLSTEEAVEVARWTLSASYEIESAAEGEFS